MSWKATSLLLSSLLLFYVQDPERQKECEELLGPVGDDKFTYLKDVGRLITDFSQPDDEPGAPGDALDDDIGVAVEFEGDEDADEESEVDEVEVLLGRVKRHDCITQVAFEVKCKTQTQHAADMHCHSGLMSLLLPCQVEGQWPCCILVRCC